MFAPRLSIAVLFSLTTLTTYSMTQSQASEALHQNFISQKPIKPSPNKEASLLWQEVSMPAKHLRGMYLRPMKDSALIYAYSWSKYGSEPGFLFSKDGGSLWENLPLPASVQVTDLASLDANNLILINEKGVYLSENQGLQWTQSNHGLPKEANLKSIKVVDANTIYLLASANIYRSIDAGKTWTPASFNLPKYYVGYLDLAVRGNLLVVAVASEYKNELYISTNGGDYWYQPSPNWRLKEEISTVGLNSKQDIFVHMGLHLYKTDTEGKAFVQVDKDIPERNYRGIVKIDSNDAVYFLIEGYPALLYKSYDDGAHWELLRKFEPIEPYDDYTSDADSFSFLQDGKIAVQNHWAALISDASQKQYSPIASMPAAYVSGVTDQGYVTSNDNLYYYQPDHSDWELVKEDAYYLANFNNKLITVSGKGKIEVSKDKGQSFEEVFQFPHEVAYGLYSSSNRIWAINPPNCDYCVYPGAYLSTNGEDWREISKNSVITGMYAEDDTIYYTDSKLVKKSVDNGLTWKTIMDFQDGNHVELKAYKKDLLVLTVHRAGVIKSTDGGKSWSLINNGLSNWVFKDLAILDANTYLVSTFEGVFLTTNGGLSWTLANKGLKSINVEDFYITGSNLYVATKGSGVYRAVW